MKKLENIEAMIKTAKKELPSEIERCDFFRTSFWLGDAGEAYGRALEILDQFPKNPKIIEKVKYIMWHHDDVWRLRDEFASKCRCERK